MTTFTSFMGSDHHRCDELFAAAEVAVEKGDWAEADTAHQDFLTAMRQHLLMEEEVLFPEFESETGSSMGPTSVMRHEHGQMLSLFDDMSRALASHQADEYLGAAETLLILMQQHNAKEEQILYPTSDRILASRHDEVLEKMQELSAE